MLGIRALDNAVVMQEPLQQVAGGIGRARLPANILQPTNARANRARAPQRPKEASVGKENIRPAAISAAVHAIQEAQRMQAEHELALRRIERIKRGWRPFAALPVVNEVSERSDTASIAPSSSSAYSVDNDWESIASQTSSHNWTTDPFEFESGVDEARDYRQDDFVHFRLAATTPAYGAVNAVAAIGNDQCVPTQTPVQPSNLRKARDSKVLMLRQGISAQYRRKKAKSRL